MLPAYWIVDPGAVWDLLIGIIGDEMQIDRAGKERGLR